MKVGIGRAAAELGVSRDTLRRWEAAGKIHVERTPSGHRRYDLAQLWGLVQPQIDSNRITIAYASVLDAKQKQELRDQVSVLESYCTHSGWAFEVIQDVGASINYRKSGLRQLIQRICQGNIERLVLARRDRLLQVGAELVFTLCERFGTEVVILNANPHQLPDDKILEEIVDSIASVLARLQGNQNEKNQIILRRLMDMARELE
jgi:predicted site-specific integrase-resolvase